MTSESARPCPLCGTDNSGGPVLPVSRDPWLLKKCAKCELIYLENPPAVEALEEEFAWEKTSKAETARRWRENPVTSVTSGSVKAVRKNLLKRRKLRSLIKRFAKPGKIIDVGCGPGSTLLDNMPQGFTPWGVEISLELAEQTRALYQPLGGDVVQGDALAELDKLDEGSFTAATAVAIVEHVPDVVALLSKIGRVVEPGGVIIIKVPNYATLNRIVRGRKWCGYRFPDHVSYFTPKTLRDCVAKAGLEIARFGVLDRQLTSDNMWCVLRQPAA